MHNLKDKNVVVIGGGTGTSVFLRTLKHFTKNITAIVTVADDGGSSRMIREDFGIIPPGDIRNCMSALSDDENIMKELFDVRFQGGLLSAHSLGNLILAAMTEITGSFPKAVKQLQEVLKINGNVYPVSETPIVLEASLTNGTKVKGESAIPKTVEKRKTGIESVSIIPKDAPLLEEARVAVRNADVVVFCPGSLYTSLIPNLLVGDLCAELEASKAVKYYVCNIMTQPGETQSYSVEDHVRAIEKHSFGHKVFDYVVYNVQEIDSETLLRYKNGKSLMVKKEGPESDINNSYIGLNMVDISNEKKYIRHNSQVFWEYLDNKEE